MWPVATDWVAWSVFWLVCLSVTTVSPAQMAEPIEMPFGMWTQAGPRNYVSDEDPAPPWQGALLTGSLSDFSYMLSNTIPSGSDIKISPHVVDQHSDCRPQKQSSVIYIFAVKNPTMQCGLIKILSSLFQYNKPCGVTHTSPVRRGLLW